MTFSDLPLTERAEGFARKHRSIRSAVVTVGILVSAITTMAAWWWLLVTFVQWLMLAAIDALV